MAAIHETAYPRLKPSFNAKELNMLFSPTEEEMDFLDRETKKSAQNSRVGFMLMLKYYQHLGRPIATKKIQIAVKKHIENKLGIDAPADLLQYNKRTRVRHIKAIRSYLRINEHTDERRKTMKQSALEAAKNKENLADIINCILEDLIKNYFEIPAFKKLLRLARAARVVTNNDYYKTIFSALTENQKNLIDKMFCETPSDNDIERSLWDSFKQESKKPTPQNIKSYLGHVQRLQTLRDEIRCDLDSIAPARLEQLKEEAQVADVTTMRRMRELKRYAMTVIFINMSSAFAIDDLVQIFITWTRNIETQAKYKLEEYRLAQGDKTDELITVLHDTLIAVKNNPHDTDKIRAIENTLDGKLDDLIEQCREHMGLTGENHLVWMLKPYKNKRHILFGLLDYMRIISTSQDQSLINALQFIRLNKHSHKQWLDINTFSEEEKPDLSLLTESWFKMVTGVAKGNTVTKIHRPYYEMAILGVLANDLQCGDVYIEGAFIFDDPTRQFISWEQFSEEVDNYCDISNIPKTGIEMVATLQQRLKETASRVDTDYPQNPYLVIENGLPVLKKLAQKPIIAAVEEIKQLIMAEMPVINIVDLIIEVENWLQLSRYFKPLSGNESKMADYPPRFVATALAYGCNMGPTQAERSLLKFSRKQIAWLFNHHINDARLLKALRFIINQFHLFDLPLRWGSGESQSVDGTFIDMYKQNILAAHHIRYGRYGGVGYYHISDQYIALYGNFISCGVHESVYLLDGIVANDSDIRPNKVHGDSWAQSEVLFGLSFLLGIKIMPRIKQFKHLHYYKASKNDHYQNIDDLFTEKSIDWTLIETHYYDMLRIAISIQKGKVKASTVLRRLCSKSRKNKLYFAFRELGRVERTLFLLNYINDPEMRSMIQAATCKSEEFNEFSAWVRFGDGGLIHDNMRANQQKIMRFGHLLANMIIFHNVVHQTRAINKLRSQGIDISDEVLGAMAPYWREHLNRFGMFFVDMGRDVAKIEYDLANAA